MDINKSCYNCRMATYYPAIAGNAEPPEEAWFKCGAPKGGAFPAFEIDEEIATNTFSCPCWASTEIQEGFAKFMSAPNRRGSPQVELGTEWYLRATREGQPLHLFWIQDTEELVAAELWAGTASIVMPGGYVNADYTGKYIVLGRFSKEDIMDVVGIEGGVLMDSFPGDEQDDALFITRDGTHDEAPEM